MEANNWDNVFHPNINISVLAYTIWLMAWIATYYIRWKWDMRIICVLEAILLVCLIYLFIRPKIAYFKIDASGLIIWWLDIPSFRKEEKHLLYNNIEDIAMLKNPANSIHIKLKDQEKKVCIDWFSDESFNEIKNILVWKWLPVSVSKMVGTKRETEDFNKNS